MNRRALLFAVGMWAVAGAAMADRQDERIASIPAAAPPDDRVEYRIKPSDADPAVKQFDEDSVVMFNRGVADHAPLAVFMTGTGGKPKGARLILSVIANQGYRAVGLAYNDEPSVMQICPPHPDPDCPAKVRQRRTYGDAATDLVEDAPAEAIVPRLVALLKKLDAEHPDEHWGEYLDGDRPKWGHIVVSGQSQGAGMAAFIAKQHAVARVVLFSSPWDYVQNQRHLAPWLSLPSATPPERWFACYHQLENTAEAISRAYAALGIPPGHIGVIKTELPNKMLRGDNPYHASMAQLPAYVPFWQAMFGTPKN